MLTLAAMCNSNISTCPIHGLGFVQIGADGTGVCGSTAPGREPLAMASMVVSFKGGAPIDAVHVIECLSLGAAGGGVRVSAVLRPTRSSSDGSRASEFAPFALAEAHFTDGPPTPSSAL